MSPHSDVFCAAAEAFGVKAIVLPEPDDRNLLYSNSVTSGKECLPYRVTLGDFIRFFRDNGHGTVDFSTVEGFMAGSFGPCRLGKYALEQVRILKEMGFDVPIRTTVSNNGYRDVNLGKEFERLAWKGMVAVDFLQRLLRRTRPYEKKPGAADQLFNDYLTKIVENTRRKENYSNILKQATTEFRSLIDPSEPRRPLVGINGEIFLRLNRFSNKDLEKTCEAAGLEVVVSSMAEWVEYVYYRNLEDAIKEKSLKKTLVAAIKRWVLLRDKHTIAQNFKEFIDKEEPSTQDILKFSGQYLSPRCGSEAVLSIGTGIEWMENPEFAGVISVMPHGCMPGGIVAAMSNGFSAKYKKPWLTLTYDGFPETTNLAKINSFAELIKFCHNGSR
jgi:predicted nucleotide-binding protein (sugar kinase/HSP70/actin superfamily)